MSTQIVRKPVESESLVPSSADSMLALIERAVSSPQFDVEKLKELLALRQRYEDNEARKAFVAAMSAFKSHAIAVVKDKTNQQYGSKYVSLGNLVNTVTPFLSQHGLSVRWDQEQPGGTSIKVSCVITHVLGHSESVSLTVPPDTSGAKNPIQQIKSAITYAKACTFESICGLASTDATLDDDGNGAGRKPNGNGNGHTSVESDWLQERCEWLANSRNREEIDKIFKTAYSEASNAGDLNAQRRLIAAKDARKREL